MGIGLTIRTRVKTDWGYLGLSQSHECVFYRVPPQYNWGVKLRVARIEPLGLKSNEKCGEQSGTLGFRGLGLSHETTCRTWPFSLLLII